MFSYRFNYSSESKFDYKSNYGNAWSETHKSN